MTKACMRCFVRGNVQGVFFRANTHTKAAELGLTGWAHNLEEGHVEVYACGEETALQALYDWLWEGSPEAEVTDVSRKKCPYEDLDSFTIQ